MHRSAWLVLSLALSSIALPACDPVDAAGSDDAPLSDYDALFRDAPGNDELPFDLKADGPAPVEHTDLLEVQSPVKSQGKRGVCSIFSTVALMEHLYIAAGADEPDFSEQYLQWSVKFEVSSFPDSSGSNAFFNLRAINEFGIPVEDAWPYEEEQWNELDDPECAEANEDKPTRCYTNGAPPASALEAEKFHLPPGRFINSSRASIMDHIRVSGTGVVVGLDFFYQAWNHRKSTLPRNLDNWDAGIVLYPNAEDVEVSHEQRAGHSILLVGWDQDLEIPLRDAEGEIVVNEAGEPVTEKGFFIFKNSWGTAGFGIDNPHGAGYGFISMRYVEEHGSARVADLPEIVVPPPGDDGAGDDGAAEEETFASDEALEIPDADPAGVSSTIVVPGDPAAVLEGDVSIALDIAHSWRGDLVVRLHHAGVSAVLHDREGGGQANLVTTLQTSAFAGTTRSGEWVLEVVDTAKVDTGRLVSWAITLPPTP
jgi:hypothetical protein